MDFANKQGCSYYLCCKLKWWCKINQFSSFSWTWSSTSFFKAAYFLVCHYLFRSSVWVEFVVTIKAKCFNHCYSIDEIDHLFIELGQAILKLGFQLFNVLDQKNLVHWKNYNSNICDTKVFFQGRIIFFHELFYHCLPSHTLHVHSNMQNKFSFCSLAKVYKHVSFKCLFFKQVVGG